MISQHGLAPSTSPIPYSTTGLSDLYQLSIRGSSTHSSRTAPAPPPPPIASRAPVPIPGRSMTPRRSSRWRPSAISGRPCAPWTRLCGPTASPPAARSQRSPSGPLARPQVERLIIPGGSIPFRNSSTVWVVDPRRPGLRPARRQGRRVRLRLRTVRLGSHPGCQGQLVVPCRVRREIFLVEAPFGASPRFLAQGTLSVGRWHPAGRPGAADRARRTGPGRDGNYARLIVPWTGTLAHFEGMVSIPKSSLPCTRARGERVHARPSIQRQTSTVEDSLS